MKTKLLLIAWIAYATLCFAQTSPPTAGGSADPYLGRVQTPAYSFTPCTISNSGGSCTFNNVGLLYNLGVDETITGSPATISIVINGCSKPNGSGVCAAIDTYTTVANDFRSPVLTKPYASFTITASWTGGSSPTVTLSPLTAAKMQGTGSGSSSPLTGDTQSSSGSPTTTTTVQLHETVGSVNNAASPYSALAADVMLRCDASAGAVNVLLPAATGTRREIQMKKIDSSANTCTFTRNGSDTIDGSATVVLSTQYAESRLQDASSGFWDRLHQGQLGGDLSGIPSNGVVAKVNGNTPGGTCTNGVVTGIDTSARPSCQTSPTVSGTVTAGGFTATPTGGKGGQWAAPEGTDPATEAAGVDVIYASSSSHCYLMSLNNSAAANNCVPGMNQANTASANFTLDASAASTASGIRLPNGAGAVPTVAGVPAWDSTLNAVVVGDGTNTSLGLFPLIGGGTGSTVASGSSSFFALYGLGAGSATEAQRFVSFADPGTLVELCVQIDSAQPTGQTLTITVRDHIIGSTTSNTTMVISIAALSAAGKYCTTTNPVTLQTTHAYSLSIAQGAGGGGAASPAIYGISGRVVLHK